MFLDRGTFFLQLGKVMLLQSHYMYNWKSVA